LDQIVNASVRVLHGRSHMPTTRWRKRLGGPMRIISDNSERRLLAGSIALLVALLAGCAGGGGGGGGAGSGTPAPIAPKPDAPTPVAPTPDAPTPVAPAPIGSAYPPSLTAAANNEMGAISSAYTQRVDTITPAPSGGTVSASRNGAEFTFIVSGIPLPAPKPSEPQFQFTVNLANPPGRANDQGFFRRTWDGAGCGACFLHGTVGTVDFAYLDLAAAGMVYSTVGLWSKRSTADPGNPTALDPGTVLGGAFAFGVLTRGADLPTTATATYTGPFAGRVGDPTGQTIFRVGAIATATADFGARSVSFRTEASLRGFQDFVIPDSKLDLIGTMTYAPGTNSLTGTVATKPGGYDMSGTLKGAFFGPPGTAAPFAPPELGGVVAVSNTTTNKSMVGAFALKK
jgi:hypothetical protein